MVKITLSLARIHLWAVGPGSKGVSVTRTLPTPLTLDLAPLRPAFFYHARLAIDEAGFHP